ncbi:hypothetical protein [Novosphingobium endophyticum]|nr:hypothetical protein [Novosphingobium endophyticum]
MVEKALFGRQCEIARREADWAINIAGGGSIALPVPWRIVTGGLIAFADEDDGQQFGLPAPVDGAATANELIGSRSIIGISVDSQTSDLALHFEDGIRLDAFNNSSGYEGWQISLLPENGGMSVVALGGGGVAIY